MNGKRAKKLRKIAKELSMKSKMTNDKCYKGLKRLLKAGILTLLLIMCASACFADKLIIQRDCYPRELQAEFLERGYVLDLNGIDRTKESWGFIENEGNQYMLYTYKSVTDKELTDILEIINHG